jgi:hypothetical protein
MREQWEMCVIQTSRNQISGRFKVIFYSPQKSVKKDFPIKEEDDYFCNLLADGWEPYSYSMMESIPVHCFRRRASGVIEVKK